MPDGAETRFAKAKAQLENVVWLNFAMSLLVAIVLFGDKYLEAHLGSWIVDFLGWFTPLTLMLAAGVALWRLVRFMILSATIRKPRGKITPPPPPE